MSFSCPLANGPIQWARGNFARKRSVAAESLESELRAAVLGLKALRLQCAHVTLTCNARM